MTDLDFIKPTTRKTTLFESDNIRDICFRVGQEPIFTSEGEEIPEYRATMNLESKEVLYVGKGYVPVHNEDIAIALDVFEREGYTLNKVYAESGKKFMIEMVNNDMSVMINERYEAKPRIMVKNSYDGSQSLTIQYGVYIQICSNGLTAGTQNTLRFKHTKHVEDINLEEIFQRGLDYSKNVFKAMSRKEWVVSNQPNSPEYDYLVARWKELIKPFDKGQKEAPIVADIVRQIQVEKNEGRQGEFAMMMGATHVATHRASEYSHNQIRALNEQIGKVFLNEKVYA